MPPKTSSEKKMWTDDPIRDLINKRAVERGESWASLSKKLKRNHSYFQQYFKRGTPRHLPERLRYQLAKLLGIEESRLRGFFHMEQDLEQPEIEQQQQKEGDGFDATITRQIPTYGHDTGGRRGEFKFSDANKKGDVPAPPALVNVRDAYALYMVGDLMEPRYYDGELVYVHPELMVRKGDFCVLHLIDSSNAGKDSSPVVLVRKQIDKTTFAQLNPYEEMKLEPDQIVARHRIILAGSGGS